MKSIHLDVEAARAVQRNLLNQQASLNRLLQQMNGIVHGLPPCWQSGSAEEFFGYYYQSAGVIAGVASSLAEIASELDEAIAQWERMADQLSR